MSVSTFSKYFKEFCLGLIYFFLIIFAFSFLYIKSDLSFFGAWLGKFAIGTFWLIAIPGILKRFKVKNQLRNVQIVIKSARRRLGVLMFLFVVMHYFWLRAFGYILYGPPSQIKLFEFFGFSAMILLIPLTITSNTWSVKKLKKWWKRIHYTSYPIMLLIIFHTILQGQKDLKIFNLDINSQNLVLYGIPSLIIIFFQIFSWLYHYKSLESKT